MKALVFHGPGELAWEGVPDPGLEADTDVIVSVGAVTICGTDLHLLKGDVAEVADHQIDPTPLITHRFELDEFLDAYDLFGRLAETGALNVRARVQLS